jgi:hypothetical protein
MPLRSRLLALGVLLIAGTPALAQEKASRRLSVVLHADFRLGRRADPGYTPAFAIRFRAAEPRDDWTGKGCPCVSSAS